MIGYVTLGTNDLERSAAFYDQLLAPLGARRTVEGERFIAWGTSRTASSLGVIKPFDGLPALRGNGTMVALVAKDRAQVDEFYAHAKAHGCTCEGAPGERMPGFYAAYFRTPEGHKMNIYKIG